MRDRTPTRALENGALRYGVYAEDGSLLRYEYLALEDDPTDPGTELSKATLLQDSTEVSLFGSAADRTVDDAFAGIAGQLKLIKSDMASITLTVQDTNGKPIPEALVQGILSESGQAVYTNASGVVTGYIGEGAQVIKVSGYADLVDYSETVTVVKGTTINKTIKLTTRNFLKITSSRSIKFSGNVNTVDVTAVGGGGSGASGSWDDTSWISSGPGGGGGDCSVQENVSFVPNKLYSAVVGSGGDDSDGGTSSFLGVSASGGKRGLSGNSSTHTPGVSGAGNGRGGDPVSTTSYRDSMDGKPGTDGSTSGYSSFSETTKYGGGGGGGGIRSGAGGSAGGFGGKGGNGTSGEKGENGQDGFGGGGGGSGISVVSSGTGSSGYGGRGGSGCVAIRMHLKSAA